jgi:hypothetical protein
MFKVKFWISRFYMYQFKFGSFRSEILKIFANNNTFFEIEFDSIYYIHLIDKNNNIIVKVPFKLQNLNDDDIYECYYIINWNLRMIPSENLEKFRSKLYKDNFFLYVSKESEDIIDSEYLLYIFVNSSKMFYICN